MMTPSDRGTLVRRLLGIIHDMYGKEYCASELDLKERLLLFTK